MSIRTVLAVCLFLMCGACVRRVRVPRPWVPLPPGAPRPPVVVPFVPFVPHP